MPPKKKLKTETEAPVEVPLLDVQMAMFRVAEVGKHFLSDHVRGQSVNARGKTGYVSGMRGIFFDGSFGKFGGGHYKFADPDKWPGRGWSCGYKEGFQIEGTDQFCQWNAYNLSQNNAWNLVSLDYTTNVVRIMDGLQKLSNQFLTRDGTPFRNSVATVYYYQYDEDGEEIVGKVNKSWTSNWLKDIKLIKNNAHRAQRM